MSDKKTFVIIVLLALVFFIGVGWFKARTQTGVNSSNVSDASEIFHEYDAYLDQSIYISPMQTSSMAPAIRAGDKVLWVKIEDTNMLEKGDIIVFKHPNKDVDNIAHRIVEVGTDQKEGQFLTQGDKNTNQVWVPSGNIRGLVIGVIYS